jgi:carbon starvation protein
LEIVAPAWNFHPAEAPMIFPFLFITVACGAISGFHCLVSSGTSSKQLEREPDARFVGYGAMLTEGFLATIVILACVAGLGLGAAIQQDNLMSFPTINSEFVTSDGVQTNLEVVNGTVSVGHTTDSGYKSFYGAKPESVVVLPEIGVAIDNGNVQATLISSAAFNTRYQSWSAAGGLARTVGAFVDGSANFLKSMGIPGGIAVALMGVLVASFAGTTLDTACRLQRYVVQELAATFLPSAGPRDCVECGYDLTANVSGKCPECGWEIDWNKAGDGIAGRPAMTSRALYGGSPLNPLVWLRNKHGATLFAIAVAAAMAAVSPAGGEWSWAGAGKGGMILWPMFGATNQLLGGLAFLVIGFYLWRRSKPVWFLVLPMLFMLIMPAWAMTWQLFIGSDDQPAWLYADSPNWALIVIAAATLVLEAWMVLEAVLLWPKVKGVLEPQLVGMQSGAEAGK